MSGITQLINKLSSVHDSSGYKKDFDEINRKKTSNSVRNKIKNKTKAKSRSELWMEHSNSKQLMDSNPGYYRSLIENFKGYPNP